MSTKSMNPLISTLEYQGQQGRFDFDGNMIVGNIQSKTALRLIREWASLHRRELETNWENMKAGRALDGIEPLEERLEEFT